MMEFVSSREIRVNPKPIFERLGEGEVVITSRGKPVALMLGVSGEDLEETVRAVRRAKAELAVSDMRRTASARGLKAEDVNVEIAAHRDER
ncbi:MAG: type II toxin-antitoxin system Phd/YefM family antitoxin [Actinomycetota bacterium]|jgi:antitoxin (DNA-binding transcriptional repressor) of toxin-antitoxin stability system|nr:type II toxin-antitoxin system Phd/YefM family antitoxin [Actinomycetota bacterium]